MKQVAGGLKFLHDNGVVHRDMKPANILYDQHFNWKISDLGLARIIDRSMTPTVGTPLYFAPEQTQKHYDSKVDVYAFGLIIFEICYPIRNYEHQRECFKGLRKSKARFPEAEARLPIYSTEYDDMIRGMIQETPAMRTGSDDVVLFLDQKTLLKMDSSYLNKRMDDENLQNINAGGKQDCDTAPRNDGMDDKVEKCRCVHCPGHALQPQHYLNQQHNKQPQNLSTTSKSLPSLLCSQARMAMREREIEGDADIKHRINTEFIFKKVIGYGMYGFVVKVENKKNKRTPCFEDLQRRRYQRKHKGNCNSGRFGA